MRRWRPSSSRATGYLRGPRPHRAPALSSGRCHGYDFPSQPQPQRARAHRDHCMPLLDTRSSARAGVMASSRRRIWPMGASKHEGHTGAVFCVAQGGPHLFSAGEDAGAGVEIRPIGTARAGGRASGTPGAHPGAQRRRRLLLSADATARSRRGIGQWCKLTLKTITSRW